jgi:uncharacterized protein
MASAIASLRSAAIGQALFAPVTLRAAMERLGFVQADPIRAPARAQDLILRQRVDGYREGDLARGYGKLGLEEDFLYAYGFLTHRLWQLTRPQERPAVRKLDRRVLDVVRRAGSVHPRDLDGHFGRKRERNAWGGYSQATKRALERLHHHGLLRVAGRENGIRVYEETKIEPQTMDPDDRLGALLLALAGILGPIRTKLLQRFGTGYRRRLPGASSPAHVISGLLKSGRLGEAVVDGVRYLSLGPVRAPAPQERRVRFLAPFDPLVWDRERFEQLWGWSYRFEAYTPPSRRIRGYYALPLLWGEDVIGWANAAVDDGRLVVTPGFSGTAPKEKAFLREAQEETRRLAAFLEGGPLEWELRL